VAKGRKEVSDDEHPLSYWVSLARMGFENDFHRLFDELGISRAELAKRLGTSPEYVTKVLNGSAGNFQLSTMAKWARALGAIVQIRLIKEGEEVVRVVDYETAAELDDRRVEQKEETPIDDFPTHRERFKASTA
jgi:transcriptional regulator with XRE-family HTH domain